MNYTEIYLLIIIYLSTKNISDCMLLKLNIDTKALVVKRKYSEDPDKLFYLIGSSFSRTNEHYLIFLSEDGERRIHVINNIYPFFYVRTVSRLEVADIIEKAGMMNKVKKIESVQLKNPISRKEELVTKVSVKKPIYVVDSKNAENGVSYLFDQDLVHESHKSFFHTVINESGLSMGMPYRFKDGKPVSVELDWDKIMNLYRKYNVIEDIEDMSIAKMLMAVLHAPMPDFSKMIFAYDIEIQADYGENVSPKYGELPIASIAVTNYEKTVVFVLSNKILGNKRPRDAKKYLDGSFEMRKYDSERELLIQTLRYCHNLPQQFAVSYNGDGFDIPYIYRRLQVFNLDRKFGIVGFEMDAREYGEKSWKKSYYKKWKGKFLIDLYPYFSNGNIKAGAYNTEYENNKLDTVAKTILGESKYHYESTISKLCMEELSFYNAKDTELTFDLFTHDSNFPGFILFFIMRIGNLSLENANRQGVTNWWAGLMYKLFVELKTYAPNYSQLDRERNEKLKGGIVLNAKTGVHYNVDVYDFSSLYPTTQIKNNICFSTINCGHKECRTNVYKLPENMAHICTKNRGYMPIILSFLRNARVKFWKQEGKKGDFFYKNLAQFAKIFMNSGYGVLENLGYPFAHRTASQLVTATARDYLMKLVDEVGKKGGEVIYGDSVSDHESIVFKFMKEVYVMKILDMWDFFAEKYFEPTIYKETKERMLLMGVEVWDGKLWSSCNAIIRHMSWKSMYRVANGHGTVDVTEDHSLINANGEEFTPRELGGLNSKHTIQTYKYPLETKKSKAKFIYVFYFLFSLCGTASESYTVYKSQRSLMLQFHPKYTKQATTIFKKIAPLLDKFHTKYRIYHTKRRKTVIKFTKNIDKLWNNIREKCYVDGRKIKPYPKILNVKDEKMQKMIFDFLKAYYYRKDRDNYPRWVIPMGSEFMLFSLLAEKFEKLKYIFIPSGYGNSIHAKYWKYTKRKQTVQILNRGISMVYDLDTENSKFLASNVLVHNTDSVFVINIEINEEDYFSEQVGINIENEGEDGKKILMMILYSKKNYIKIMQTKRVIKGMTGKKKNNSKLVRKYFAKAVDSIQVDMSLSEIRDKIGDIMKECEEVIEERKFSLNEISVTQSLSKDIEDYKVSTPLVQAVRSMKQFLESKDQIVNTGKMGNIIDFVKTSTGYMPISIVDPKNVDTEYYIKQLYGVFNQLTIPLGIAAEKLIESKKYASLDRWFK